MKSTVKKSDLIIVFCLVLVFGAIIYMNNRLISTTMLYQIEQVSQNRLEIVRSDYENISIEVEQAMLNIINGVEKIYYSGGSREDLETMLTATNAQLKEESAGVILRVYAVNPDWVILPGEEFPEGYHPTEQEWYRGAVESPETLYFADPYYDVLTGIMCFTLTMSMDDGKTVIGMDMKLDGIEEYVQRMAGEDKSPALIVTDEGVMSYLGYCPIPIPAPHPVVEAFTEPPFIVIVPPVELYPPPMAAASFDVAVTEPPFIVIVPPFEPYPPPMPAPQ